MSLKQLDLTDKCVIRLNTLQSRYTNLICPVCGHEGHALRISVVDEEFLVCSDDVL